MQLAGRQTLCRLLVSGYREVEKTYATLLDAVIDFIICIPFSRYDFIL